MFLGLIIYLFLNSLNKIWGISINNQKQESFSSMGLSQVWFLLRATACLAQVPVHAGETRLHLPSFSGHCSYKT